MATIQISEPNHLHSNGTAGEDKLNSTQDILPHIHLSASDSQLFADLMEADEEPNEALKRAALEYRKLCNQTSQ